MKQFSISQINQIQKQNKELKGHNILPNEKTRWCEFMMHHSIIYNYVKIVIWNIG